MTNYNKMSNKEVSETVIEETVAPAVDGMVSDCVELYVRSAPSVDAEPLGTIKQGARVQIFESESTDEFYSVCTETGLEGFCMKKFVTVL